MLEDRIINTLRFFDLQGIPLTLFELHKFLLAENIEQNLGDNYEVVEVTEPDEAVSLEQVREAVENAPVKNFRGYYFLPHRDENFITKRLQNYLYGIRREQLIARYKSGLRFVPFLRGLGLVGSQALGQYKPNSDIDVLIIVEPGFMWLGRFLITSYFHFLGIRRHGKHVANRFCLNHYVAGPKILAQDRNIYTASEYIKMRPLYGADAIAEFKENNLDWLKMFFPNFEIHQEAPSAKKVFNNRLTRWLEAKLKRYQLSRINRGQFVVALEDELSFHPDNRKAELFRAFFENQKQNSGEAVSFEVEVESFTVLRRF